MKYKVLRGFCLGAGKDVYPGDVIALDDKSAPYHLARARVAPLAAEPEPLAPLGEGTEETPVPKKRTR